MKRASLVLKGLIAAASLAAAASAHADAYDCFPACPEPVKATERKCDDPSSASESIKASARETVAAVESVNAQLKPVKDIVGYVRSPQGLVVKLVNDHVVKIPAWVGYAIDPVGSLKNRALSEVRDTVKASIKESIADTGSCKVEVTITDVASGDTAKIDTVPRETKI
jgi:hypothetical protein